MTWPDTWRAIFGSDPPKPSSREESVQEVLARLIAGRAAKWFEPYETTPGGACFLAGVAEAAFADAPSTPPDWFVSEYELPVPDDDRLRRGKTYGCPDFAAAWGRRLVVIELKTERGSVRAAQPVGYLELAALKHPGWLVDLVLFGPHRPLLAPPLGEGQRYGELTWADVVSLLASCWPDDESASRLAAFLSDQFPAVPAAREPGPASAGPPPLALEAARLAVEQAGAFLAGERTAAALDLRFDAADDARAVARAVNAQLSVKSPWSLWVWTTTTGGQPLTEAGRASGIEVRLQRHQR